MVHSPSPVVAPFGTWRSAWSAASVAAAGPRLGAPVIDGSDIYWLEGRPREGGRYVLVRRRQGSIGDAVPGDFNVRSRVHEYGGGAYVVHEGALYCVNFADQRIYRVGEPEPQPLTPAGAWRYADIVVDQRRQRLVCVREDHTRPGEPINALVSIPIGPAKAGDYDMDVDHWDVVSGFSRTPVLAAGADFYSTPRLNVDGSKLAWLSWRHPFMPWDGTELWVADLDGSGLPIHATRIAGGTAESIYQPGWSPDGLLYYVSDRDGWWKIYRVDCSRPGSPEPVVRNPAPNAEFGRPQWIFGTSTWTFATASQLIVSYTRKGRWHLGLVDLATGMLTDVVPDLHPHEWVVADDTHAVLVVGSSSAPDAVVRVNLASAGVETIRSASPPPEDPESVSVAVPVEFPSGAGRTAHAFYYPPRNSRFRAAPGERPPLIVITHGGPTAAAHATLDVQVQFWTSRGFAIVDVNYTGSSGYGRAYREGLNGEWGVADVADVINAAQYLVDSGRADPRRLIIRGGSAGGYTTLAALTFRPEVFKAGASYYGISDLEVLELDTHKFESRYSHRLIGPYPEQKALYRARSPIHAIEHLSCPLILFQGLEDKIVPPNQSQMMADAVRAKGLPVAYLAFEGEQHGFRRAETIVRCLEAELFFYGAIFGFTPADPIAPVPIENVTA